MALHFDYSKTNTEGWTDRDYEVMNHFIWGSICVDMGSITEKNLEEWLFRMEFYNTVSRYPTKYFGYLDAEGKEQDYGLEDLRKCVGLVTNVYTMPRKTWIKKVVDHLVKDIANDVKRDMEKTEEVTA